MLRDILPPRGLCIMLTKTTSAKGMELFFAFTDWIYKCTTERGKKIEKFNEQNKKTQEKTAGIYDRITSMMNNYSDLSSLKTRTVKV